MSPGGHGDEEHVGGHISVSRQVGKAVHHMFVRAVEVGAGCERGEDAAEGGGCKSGEALGGSCRGGDEPHAQQGPNHTLAASSGAPTLANRRPIGAISERVSFTPRTMTLGVLTPPPMRWQPSTVALRRATPSLPE